MKLTFGGQWPLPGNKVRPPSHTAANYAEAFYFGEQPCPYEASYQAGHARPREVRSGCQGTTQKS